MINACATRDLIRFWNKNHIHDTQTKKHMKKATTSKFLQKNAVFQKFCRW